MDRKQIGRIGLSMAINYFTLQGYTVSLPINDTQWYDLIIEKEGIFKTVQCKATNTKDQTIDLRETGGTKGKEYGNVLAHDKLDILFCVNSNLNIWIFPIKDLIDAKVKNTISLRNSPNSNNQGFQTYKYLISGSTATLESCTTL